MRTRRLGRGTLIAVAGIIALSIPLTISSAADAATVSVTTGGVTYTADDTNVAAGATVTGYDNSTAAVTIVDHVTIGLTSYAVKAIAGSVFSGSSVMTSVTIPNTVTTIGTNAFSHLGNVTSIVIPDSVTSIGTFAFDSIDKLTSITIGSGITAIPTQAFSNANHLLSVTIPSAVTSIAFAAFAADDLRTLVIGSGVTTIGDSAFAYNNNLTSVTVPASVTTMGNNVFQNNSSGGTFTATFLGSAPTMGTGDFSVHSPAVIFPWRYGSPQTAGGYTSPTWLGVTSTALTTTTFDANGHGVVPAAQNVLAGSSVAAPTAPTASGYSFAGWFTAASGGTNVTFPFTAATDRTLYAHWTATVTVTFDANGHGIAPAQQLVAAGSATTAPTSPTEAGYGFQGWFTAASGGTAWDFSSPVSSALTLYAHWSASTISLSAGTVVSGNTITVTGAGFTPGASLDIVLHSTPITLATVIADGSGGFSARVTIPAGTAAGAHSIVVGLATLALTVNDPAGRLPVTGADAGNEFADGGALLLGGMLLLGIALWRRRSS